MNLVQLRASLHESIVKIEQSVALKELFEHRLALDVAAQQELLVALARSNLAQHADALLAELGEVPCGGREKRKEKKVLKKESLLRVV